MLGSDEANFPAPVLGFLLELVKASLVGSDEANSLLHPFLNFCLELVSASTEDFGRKEAVE